jgi:hypothetical protein
MVFFFVNCFFFSPSRSTVRCETIIEELHTVTFHSLVCKSAQLFPSIRLHFETRSFGWSTVNFHRIKLIVLIFQQMSQYDSMPNEQFNYAHPDAGFVDASVLDEEVRLHGAVNKQLQ